MPNLKQVIDVLETLYPLRYAEQWDEPGLIVGDLGADVHRIVFAADPTSTIVDRAIAAEADLLITHHPLFFRSVHEVGGLGFRGDIVRRLYSHGCGLWVGHTNADSAWRGVGQAAADYLGLEHQRPLVPIADPQSEHPVGLGRIGTLPEPMRLKDFAQRVFNEVSAHGMVTKLGVQVCGDLDAQIQSIAVLPGSGDSLFNEVRQAGVDVYVTSDLRHHPTTDAIEQARYEARMRAQGIMLGQGSAQTHPYLINTPHAAIESMWFNYAVRDIPQAIEQATGEQVTVQWFHDTTDPWTLSITSQQS
ncbi:Nif3-like dinuclear metal center hexameric protein [Bifidobacterium sp. LC6]|uniref:GTP cyclohydrolase 1 type 2 homolog n=1 Tax=Bifidobacterium colobi TaxID=2809026 RepID=A0ABS5UUX3_9BIFI|nr:Nif3-like dinuclear metal center hexameric protein [Bifidobacterium colobi]MBT1174824.1 Nif3-like dinuclear metal center hexameric protein [Bifidobacterium colobi]